MGRVVTLSVFSECLVLARTITHLDPLPASAEARSAHSCETIMRSYNSDTYNDMSRGFAPMDALTAALVAAGTSIVVALISVQFASHQQRRGAERIEQKEINARYLNPLRFQ